MKFPFDYLNNSSILRLKNIKNKMAKREDAQSLTIIRDALALRALILIE